jgi:spermidine/putrescine transport system substrate-binding protein/spermidine/putrescine transport system permease protein
MYPIIEAGAIRYDVVCPSDYIIQKMIRNDMLLPDRLGQGAEHLEHRRKIHEESPRPLTPATGTLCLTAGGRSASFTTLPWSAPQDTPDSWNDALG